MNPVLMLGWMSFGATSGAAMIAAWWMVWGGA